MRWNVRKFDCVTSINITPTREIPACMFTDPALYSKLEKVFFADLTRYIELSFFMHKYLLKK